MIYLIIIFLLSIVPLTDFDIWFHIKSGELLWQKGIFFYDVFSHSASGREWFPYEWLFQILVYGIQQVISFDSIKYFVALCVTIQIYLMYKILKSVLNINKQASILACWFYFVSIFEFVSARPHIMAYTLLILNLYLILIYVYKNKNYLFLTLPIIYIWGNMHGSIFLGIALFFGYSLVEMILKSKKWITLFAFGIVSSIISILPPLGITQYKLLIYFFKERDLVTKFINEWAPLAAEPVGLYYFISILVLVFVPFFVLTFKKKLIKENLWILPLLVFPITAFLASRNGYLAYITITLALGFVLNHIKINKVSIVITSIFLVLSIWLLSLKKTQEKMYYPVAATQFIKSQNIQGNIFNDYGLGGYLLYHLYPEHKVFYDGRTDVYLCCEMKDTMELALNKNLSDDKFTPVINKLWDKYNISYILMNTQKHSVLRKIARNLSSDNQWSLVFWDDVSHMFVRRDGKNDQLIKDFEAKYATPYNQNPFVEGYETEALNEYLKMIAIADSSKSRNAVGYIYLKQGKIEEAKIEFEKAIALDRTNESPYMNLAEIYALRSDTLKSIEYYERALKLAPDRGLIYLRLGQLYVKKDGDYDKAKSIWQKGIKYTVDTDARNKLIEALKK